MMCAGRAPLRSLGVRAASSLCAPRALVEDERAAADEDVDRVVDLLERVAEDAAGAPAEERGAEKAVRRGRDGRAERRSLV